MLHSGHQLGVMQLEPLCSSCTTDEGSCHPMQPGVSTDYTDCSLPLFVLHKERWTVSIGRLSIVTYYYGSGIQGKI